MTLELGGYKADETTEAVVEYLLKYQTGPRPLADHLQPPADRGEHFMPTYLALRGLRVWGTPEQKERIGEADRGGPRLAAETTAKDTEDRVFRLLALEGGDGRRKGDPPPPRGTAEGPAGDGGVGTARVGRRRLCHRFGPGRAPSGRRDADATRPTGGVAFLMQTQLADGSWYVKSRTKPFQPYYESGFPHGKDQFISAATGWAIKPCLASASRVIPVGQK